VNGPARVGDPDPQARPSYVGPGALVDGAIVEEDAMVEAGGRLGPSLILRRGFKVLPGKSVTTQEEAERPQLGKVAFLTDQDRAFMRQVVEANAALAVEYSRLAAEQIEQLSGIGMDPGGLPFNPRRELPTLAGSPTADPQFGGRIVGDVQLALGRAELETVVGKGVALQADVGQSIVIGRAAQIGEGVVIHGLPGITIRIGNGVRLGARAVVLGAPSQSHGGPADVTSIEENVEVGEGAIIFRSSIRAGAVIGRRAVIDGSEIRAGQRVPDGAVIVNNRQIGTVEW